MGILFGDTHFSFCFLSSPWMLTKLSCSCGILHWLWQCCFVLDLESDSVKSCQGQDRGTSDSGFSKDPCLALWGR